MPRRNNQTKYIPPRQPSCDHKKRYDTENEALRAAHYQTLINHGLGLSVYRCDLCQKWHLTKVNRDFTDENN
jgi:hypothetical protein